jgi:signal transduction histidine kinase
VKTIKITLGASATVLPEYWNRIRFAATRTIPQDILDNLEWGTGQKAYIWITVQDTGCGLTPEEQGNLFTRFSQASPRTHVQYGGSGLGLFISKSLAELQSGCIGVHSEAGVGSTFAFFIGTRIAVDPKAAISRTNSIIDLEMATSTKDTVEPIQYSVLVVEDNLVNVSSTL